MPARRTNEPGFADDVGLCAAGSREAGIHPVHYRDNTKAIAEIGKLPATAETPPNIFSPNWPGLRLSGGPAATAGPRTRKEDAAMTTLRRVGARHALGWRPAVAAVACAALAGCGQAAASHTGATGTTVCADAAHVDRLAISRASVNPGHFTFPAQITISSPRQAQAVAHALCALPVMPSGVINCPADVGISYRLRFAAGGRRLPPVTVEATGCQQVHGLGRVRWIERSPAFWGVLGTAAGIHPASYQTFRGTIAS